jgi:2-amino-4-hydroxy-6-hydroxymethyldihydropteridine diphosphokinase
MALAYFSLGSNLGDREAFLRLGLTFLSDHENLRVSSVYETEPVGGVSQDDFWNVVAEVETTATPVELLARCRAAEAAAERVRDVRWGPRTLDVDLLLLGDYESDDPELIVPHPRMWQRRFVLAPLAELRPDLVSEEVLALASGDVRVITTLN